MDFNKESELLVYNEFEHSIHRVSNFRVANALYEISLIRDTSDLKWNEMPNNFSQTLNILHSEF